MASAAPARAAAPVMPPPPIAPEQPAKHSVHDKMATRSPASLDCSDFRRRPHRRHLVFTSSSIVTTSFLYIRILSAWPYVPFGLGRSWSRSVFEFVNGVHDTANAVATVIYTHSMDPQIAVVWSGFWNFAGVVTSTGAVAFGIVSLPAGRTDLAGRLQCRFRDGLRFP